MENREKFTGEIDDTSWIRQAMFVPRTVSEQSRHVNRTYSSAGEKFFDTTLGGNLSINPKPQFTRTADLKMPSLSPSSKGMGRYYSEALDDNAFRVSLQFGVPEFNSLSQFLGNFYNPQLATLVNRGENQGFSYKLGYAVGFIMTLPLQAFFGISYLVTRLSSFAAGTPYSKFYYMKPTMPLYWNTVTSLVNHLSVSMGITQGAFKKGSEKDPLTDSEIALLNKSLPDIFKRDTDSDKNLNGIDVYAVATRAQRLADEHYARLDGIAKSAGTTEEYVKQVKAELSQQKSKKGDLRMKYPSYGEYMDSFLSGKLMEPKPAPAEGEELSENHEYVRADEPSWTDHFKAEIRDGSHFVSFITDLSNPTESFSNSVKTSAVAEKLNGANNAARDMRFSFAEGNLIGDTQKSITDAIGNFATGALDSVGLAGLSAFSGNAYVDIPKTWDSSSAELGKTSYKIRLQSPYGNKFSLLTNIYIPLCMLLAGALPRSTGKASYSSPFLCRVFSQGVTDIKLGMIDSLTITRGVGGIGWTEDRLPNAIEVDIGIVNLDEIMHVPVMESFGDGGIFSAFDEDTAIGDYLNTLSGLSLYDQYYISPRIKLAWAKTVQNFESWTSKSHMANWAAGTIPGQALSAIARGSEVL